MDLPRTRLLSILDRATEAGALAAEVLYEAEQGFEVTVERGKIADSGPRKSDLLTVRVWGEGGREGEATGPEAMSDQLIATALAASEGATPDPEAGPIGRLPAHTRGLGIDDRRYQAIEDEERIDVALDDERAARNADRRVQTGPFTYRDGRQLRALLNTRGIVQSEIGTRFSLKGELAYATSDIELAGEFTSRAFAGVSSLPLGASLARDAKRLASAEAATEGWQARFLLPPLITARLIHALSAGFTHEAFATGSSVWGKLSVGDRVMDSRFHLLDDGALPGAWHTWGFDDRGVPPVPLTLIRDGAVNRCFLSVAEARAEGTRPTGHQRRDGIGPRNLLVRSGTRSVAAILSEIGGEAFEIEHVLDWSGVDLATAELDLPIIGSVRDSKGNAEPVRGLRLRGNLVAALGQIVDVCGDTDRWRHVDAPGILLDGLRVEVAD